MRDAALPFRPKAGPDPGSLEAIRAQMARVRRRANGHAAQHAFYLAGTAAALAFTGLVPLALVLSREGYAVAVWCSFAALVVLSAFVLRRSVRRWITSATAAVAIDRRAALEERLSTLAAAAPERSRLWGLLVSQNLRLLPRWQPKAIVPRAIPRTAWLFLLALVLALTVFRWTSTTAARVRGGGASAPGEGGAEPAPGEAPGFGQGGTVIDESSLASLLASLPDELREAILGAAAVGSAKGDGAAVAKAPAGAIPPGSEMRPGEGDLPDDSLPAISPPSGAEGSGGKGGQSAEGGRSRSGQPRPDPRASQPARGEGTKPLPGVESGRPRPNGAREAGRRMAGQGGGKGAGSGGDAGGLFGTREGGLRASGSFDIDLAGKTIEGRNRPGDDEPSGDRPARDLAPDQHLDDAIRRAQVPPEYEHIIQRMFSRPAEGTELGTR